MRSLTREGGMALLDRAAEVGLLTAHGDGYYTLYGHLSSIAVSVGQEVQSGQVIAQSGDSGSLKGSVLHFEVRKGGTSLDPEGWLQ